MNVRLARSFIAVALTSALSQFACSSGDGTVDDKSIDGPGGEGNLSDATGGGNSTDEDEGQSGGENGLSAQECSGCDIDGYCVPAGTTSPDEPCMTCDPDQDDEGWVAKTDGQRCDDGAFCTVGDACQEGACVPGDQEPCSDGVSCNGEETCNEDIDACTLGTSQCSSGSVCTVGLDSCELTCAGCAIDGVCYAAGTSNPLNQCQTCSPENDASAWSPAEDGSTCSDGAFCTVGDACQEGACVPGDQEPCSDGVSCNGEETCNEDIDACTLGTSQCSSGSVCTVGLDSCELTCAGCAIDGVCYAAGTSNPLNQCQTCSPENDASAWSPAEDGSTCSDGAFCTVGDACQEGACVPGDQEPCSDGVSCNGEETCNEDIDACTLGTSQCSSGSVCTVGLDSCELTCAGCAIDGVCYAAGTPNPLNQCQTCSPNDDASAWSSVGDGAACNDGAFCNGADSCLAGSCTGTGNPCSDGVACNGVEACDEGTDSCVAGTSTCDAGTACSTGLDQCVATCDGCLIGDVCYPEGARDPANSCQACAPATSASTWTAVDDGTLCDDGNFCNGMDECSSGSCTAGSRDPCDDGVSCNGAETCHEDTDSCGAGTSSCGAGTTCDTGADACTVTCNGCLIDDVCYPDSIENPTNACQICSTTSSTVSWTPRGDGASCGYHSECSTSVCECEDGWLMQGGYCTTPKVESTDDTWTSEIYVGMEATIPAVNLLVNDQNNIGDDTELWIVEVKDAVNGSAVLDGSNILFTGSSEGGASFVYVVQAGTDVSSRFEATVSLTVDPVPPVIANSDTNSVKQGDSTVFTASSLLANDVGSNLTVLSVQDAVNGLVGFAGGTITFESTGISGQPAEFTYTIEDDSAFQATGTVYMDVTPLDPVQAYIYTDSSLLSAKTTSYAPPTTLTIFNSWGRFSSDTFWSDGTMATGGAATWTLIADEDDDGNIDGDLDGNGTDDDQTSFVSGGETIPGDVNGDGSFDARFMQTSNTNFNGFISPNDYDSYTHEVTLWSIDGDNDMVGVILAYENDGTSHPLYVARTKGGWAPNAGWGLLDGRGNSIVNFDVDGTTGGWSNAATRVKVIREGDFIQVWTTAWMTDQSQFFNPPTYEPNSLIEIDLSSTTNNVTYYSGGTPTTVSADLTRYQGLHPYGYINESQSHTSYIDVSFDGGVVDDLLVLLTDKDPVEDIYYGSEVWRYGLGSWSLSGGESIQDALGFVRTATNPDTAASFLIRSAEVEAQ